MLANLWRDVRLTLTRSARIERLLLKLLRWETDNMATLNELQNNVAVLRTQAANQEATLAAQRVLVEQAVGLFQTLAAVVADLRAQLAGGAVITQAQLDALDTSVRDAGALVASGVTLAAGSGVLLQQGVDEGQAAL